jgi:hypothetical protein
MHRDNFTFYLPQPVILSNNTAYSAEEWWKSDGLSTDLGYNRKGTGNASTITFERMHLIKHRVMYLHWLPHLNSNSFHWFAVRPPHDAGPRSTGLGLTQLQIWNVCEYSMNATKHCQITNRLLTDAQAQATYRISLKSEADLAGQVLFLEVFMSDTWRRETVTCLVWKYCNSHCSWKFVHMKIL